MKRKLSLAAALTGIAMAIAIPLVASAASSDTKFQIGLSVQLTGPDSAVGDFVAAGSIRDSGPSTVSGLAIVPIAGHDAGRITGNEAFIGQKGTIEVRFDGIVTPLSVPNQTARGSVEIVGGTGAYAHLSGHGRFLAVANGDTGRVIGTVEGAIG